MRKIFVLGLILALTLPLPVSADGFSPFEHPRFNMLGWVFDLFEMLDGELFTLKTDSTGEVERPEDPPISETRVDHEPDRNEEPPTSEMGPAIDPRG